jgi:hypothetical protein
MELEMAPGRGTTLTSAAVKPSPAVAPGQIEAIRELTLGGGTARMRSDGNVDVRVCSLGHQLEYLVTVSGERILAESTPRSARRRLGSGLALLGGGIWIPATLLAIPLTIMANVGLLPHPALWLFVIPTAGWLVAAVGASLGSDDDFLISHGRSWDLEGELPVEWVDVRRCGEDDDEGEVGEWF